MARVKYYDQASQEWKYADAALNMKGKDGYTPQKGEDYFTKEEVQELTENVINQGVLTYNKQNLTEEQKVQARKNIGIDRISMDKLNEDLDANGYRIIGLSEPQQSSEPATKGYVDTFAIEANTFVATDDGEGNVTIVPYENDVAEPTFMEHIGNKQNPHNVTAEQVGARPNTWTPTAADVGAATPGEVKTAKTEAVTAAKNYTDTQVKQAAPVNLLDNSDFRDPVNQRGSSVYNGNGYTIDRWYIWSTDGSGQLSVEPDGIALNTYTAQEISLSQWFPKGHFRDKSYTFAYQDVYGTVFVQNDPIDTSHEGFDCIQIPLKSWNKIIWAALYEGEYTLDTLPAYRPKGYGAELAECKRYFRILRGDPTLSGYIGSTATKVYFLYNDRTDMRKDTSIDVAVTGQIDVICNGTYYGANVLSAICDQTQFALNVQYIADIPPTKMPCAVYAPEDIQLSADL